MNHDTDRWDKTPIRPAPLLSALRDLVLARSEKRSPKWKFRLAPDLVLQIQPKLTLALLKFECAALRCDGADLKDLVTTKNIERGRRYWRFRFDLTATDPAQWLLKPRGYMWARDAGQNGATELREQIVAAFAEGRFDELNPTMMLGSHCLCCGKGLTDPVSQARFIGPECFGSGSPDLPFINRLVHAHADTEEFV